MKISPRTAALANLNHWRAGQGAKIKANRPLPVFRACEHIAGLLAPMRDPLILTVDEIKTAQNRAISMERRRVYGPLGKDSDEFWQQIAAIAQSWGITTARSEWESVTKTQTQAEAA